MPEEILYKLKNKLLPQYKICFFSALIFGLVTHFYKLANWLPNWDSLVFRHDPQNMMAMGRWFLSVVCAISSFYDLPWVAGLLAILLHALGAVCIIKLFQVEKKMTAALVGALVATFPTVTSVLMYNYVADGYALAFLFSALAAVLLAKDKPCCVGSAILIALSSGIYQAYITVTITLLLLFLIVGILYREMPLKQVFIKCGQFLATGICGMGLYYLVMMILLKLTGTALLDYQGFDSAASLQGIDLAGALYTIKESFVNYFFDVSNGIGIFVILNSMIGILTLIFCITDVIRKKLSAVKILMLCIFVIFLPIGASVLAFINSGIDYHNLMKMGFLVFYLIFILQYEESDFTNQKLTRVKLWSVFSVMAVLIFNQILIANITYHKLGMAYEKSYGVLIRIADRIEQTEGAEQCDKLLVLGALPQSEAYSVKLSLDMTGATDGYILRADDEIVGQSVLCSALNDYCGKDYTFLAGKEKSHFLDRNDTETMDFWPQKNSVAVMNGVIVIKLGE